MLSSKDWGKLHVNGGGDEEAWGTCPPPQSEELWGQGFACTHIGIYVCRPEIKILTWFLFTAV